jgi:hypothetical protein
VTISEQDRPDMRRETVSLYLPLCTIRSLDLKSLFCCINPVHNEPMIYGYARVSTDGQSVDA